MASCIPHPLYFFSYLPPLLSPQKVGVEFKRPLNSSQRYAHVNRFTKRNNSTQPNPSHALYFFASEIQLINTVCVSIDGATPTEYTRDELLPPNAFDEAEENERKLDAVEYEHEEVHHRRVHHPTRPQVGPERVIVTK